MTNSQATAQFKNCKIESPSCLIITTTKLRVA